MSSRYLDILANAFSEVRAWKMATVTLGMVSALLAITLIWQAQTTPIVLIPAGFAETNGTVKVMPKDAGATNPDYLGQIALGDVALIFTWQPANVEMQYQRFLNRTTSELYAKENINLLTDAKKFHKINASQAFYPEKVEVDLKTTTVLVGGYLVRWEGDKEVLREKSSIELTYRNDKGFLHVANLKLITK